MKKTIQYVRGFTLIELLVVIAIIGILSSVVLVSLNSARSKGNDARIQEEVAQIRTALESSYNGSAYAIIKNGGSNTVATGTDNNLKQLVGDIASQNTGTYGGTSGITIYGDAANSASSTSYAIYASLKSGGYYCQDSTGSNITKTASTWTANSTCQ